MSRSIGRDTDLQVEAETHMTASIGLKGLTPTILLLAFKILVLDPAHSSVAATPVTVTGAFDILDVRSVNTVGFSTGSRIFFGADATPNGSAGTTASANTLNLTTGQSVLQTLIFTGSTAIPNQFSRTIADNSDLRGPWTLIFQ